MDNNGGNLLSKKMIVIFVFLEFLILFSVQNLSNIHAQDNIITTECPEIIDLTGNTSSLGNPVTPRVWYGWEGWEMRTRQFLHYNKTSYYVYQKNMHGRNVTIAFDKKIIGLDPLIMRNYAQFIFNVWNYYWNIFEGFAYHNYTIIWLNGSVRENGGQGTGMEIQYRYDDCSLCKPWCYSYSGAAHEVFHAWNNAREGGINPPRGVNDTDDQTLAREYWFIEGFTVYYHKRGWILYKENIRSPQEYFHDFNYENGGMGDVKSVYLNKIKGTEYDIPMVELPFKFNSSLAHDFGAAKGALIAYFLDKQLTKDGFTLNDLMKYMYESFKYGEERYTAEEIVIATNTFTGKNYTQFFADYVFGNKSLPLDETTQFTFFDHDDIPKIETKSLTTSMTSTKSTTTSRTKSSTRSRMTRTTPQQTPGFPLILLPLIIILIVENRRRQFKS